MEKHFKRIDLKATVLAAALAALPLSVGAAGLGKITVLSALGQPLKAEIEVTASREEVSVLASRMASADAFRQQGVEYTAAHSVIKMTIEKRPSGQPYVRVSSDRPINEPFINLLVELSWGAGRLVREYTFLLDPPSEVTQKTVVTPVVTAPEVRVESKTEALPARPAVAMGETKPATKPEPTKTQPAKSSDKESAEGSDTRKVKNGDTLGKIAAEIKPEGVSLDQVLVALLRNNEEAFEGKNINRLRAGKILKLPEAGEIAAIDVTEARKVVVTQSADFNAYRRKLAEAVASTAAKDVPSKQADAGKIKPKVEDKAPPAPAGKDKLEVSRTDSGKDAKGAKVQGRVSALEEDLVARDRAIKDANSRIADLEKNLGDLKKLAELKSQGGAQLQQQAAKPGDAKKPEPPQPADAAKAPAPAPAAPVATVVPAPSSAKPAEKPAEPTQAPEAAKPADTAAGKPAEAGKPGEVAAPAAAPKPADSVAATAAKPAAVKKPAPPPPEPSFVEENETLVFGGAGILAMLLGYLGFTAFRKKRLAKAEVVPGVSEFSGTDMTASSVFATTGGESVNTGAALPTDFGASSAVGSEEGVDPVAEADVYMAYGRDAQAEEILIEALKKEPTRYAIHLKLLEIYAGRKALKPFETLAADLKGQTAGSGADWEKAAEMGRSIDPGNALYSNAAAVQPPASAASEATIVNHMASTVILTPDQPEKMLSTVTMPGQLAHMAAAAETAAPEEAMSLDFDLDLGGPTAPVAASSAGAADTPAPSAAATTDFDFDLDLGAPAPAAAASQPDMGALDIDLGMGDPPPAAAASADIDFALDIDASAPATPVPPPSSAPASDTVDHGLDFPLDNGAAPATSPAVAAASVADESSSALDFDFDIGGPTEPESAMPPPLDLSSISLDLHDQDDDTSAAKALATPPTAPESAAAADNPEVATKLELAVAYDEMGDKDGARELLQEVLKEGSPSQQEVARNRLAQLS